MAHSFHHAVNFPAIDFSFLEIRFLSLLFEVFKTIRLPLNNTKLFHILIRFYEEIVTLMQKPLFTIETFT